MKEFVLPDGWRLAQLIQLADYHNGASFSSKDWKEDGLPIIRIEHLNSENAETDKYSGPLLPTNYIDDGDLIFSWSATLKVIIWKKGPGVLNQHLYKVVPKPGVNKQFLLYTLDFYMDKIAGQSQGSTMKHVTRKELSHFYVVFPKNERYQKNLALVLETIDQTIEKTEALIHKYQQIKAGLMHDLFTRGVTVDGKLRPPREEAPELYKEAPMGWIPISWGLTPLKNMSQIVSGVTLSSKITTDQKIEVPYLRVANVQDGYLDLTDIKKIKVNKNTFDMLLLKKGDVLMNEGGDFDKLGRGTVWQGEIENCIHQNHVFRVRTDQNVLRPYYLAYWSESDFGKKYFVISSKQSTNLASINSTQLKAYPIAVPNLSEQKRIEDRIKSINLRLQSLKMEANKGKSIKSGLMQDLLTGKVRVKADQEEQAHV
ncbi:MAG: restriction endonuclease subunit S [Desulfobacula sp.]|nr:restriction endonuclease subunit S [Desulfobacula sp.]